MNEIGVYICNYNGKDFTINCIKSLQKQNYKDFDIFVVDNASADGSVDALKDEFGDKIRIICNPENLGGSGGFARAISEGIAKDYKYIVLLDNDIILDSSNILNMKEFMDSHPDFGEIGSMVMIMDMPDTIQDYGCRLDFDKYIELPSYKNRFIDSDIPEINECDYVPTCAVMLRSEMIRKSSIIPSDNFIYYDDIELSHRIILNGWKVAALKNVRVWHKGGFRKAIVNTFSRYYFLRNRLNFFAKYISENDIERFVDKTLTDLFPKFYGYYYKGFNEYFRSEFYAFNDFLNLIRGKADEYKILNLTEHEIPFEKLIKDKKRINIKLDGISDSKDYIRALYNAIARISNKAPQEKIWLSAAAGENDASFYIEKINEIYTERKATYDLPEFVTSSDKNDNFDLNIVPCDHVKNVKENILPDVYADKYLNCITNDEDYRFFTSMDMNEKIFRWMYRPMMIEAVHKIRKKAEEND